MHHCNQFLLFPPFSIPDSPPVPDTKLGNKKRTTRWRWIANLRGRLAQPVSLAFCFSSPYFRFSPPALLLLLLLLLFRQTVDFLRVTTPTAPKGNPACSTCTSSLTRTTTWAGSKPLINTSTARGTISKVHCGTDKIDKASWGFSMLCCLILKIKKTNKSPCKEGKNGVKQLKIGLVV